MKTVFHVCLLSLLLTGLMTAEEILFQDTFETSPEGSLNAQSLSSDNAMYSVAAQAATFMRGESREADDGELGTALGRFYNNPGETNSAWVTISTDLDPYPDYEFRIGYVNLAGYGTFVIKVAGMNSDPQGGYELVYANSQWVDVFHTDSQGERHNLGHVIPQPSQKPYSFVVRDLRIAVSGGSQTLSIDGESFGSAFPTEGVPGDGMADQIRLHTRPTTEAFDIGIDNLKTVVTPKP